MRGKVSSIEKYLEKFSNEPTRYEIGGRTNKRFVRADARLMKRFFADISRPENTYVSYVDECVKNGYIPGHICVLYKELNPVDFYTNEYAWSDVIGAEIASMLGVETVYNFVYNEKVKGEMTPTAMLSVDFLKDGEELRTFNDLGDGTFIISYFWSLVSSLRRAVEDSDQLFKGITAEEFLPKIESDIVKQFLFKKFILGDSDLTCKNIGIVINKNKRTIALAPGYDYDMCFYSHDNDSAAKSKGIREQHILQDNIYWANKYYNSALQYLIDKCKAFDAVKCKKALSHNLTIGQDVFIDDCVMTVVENIDNFLQACKEVLPSEDTIMEAEL